MAHNWNGWMWEWTEPYWGWSYPSIWTNTQPTYDPDKFDLVPKPSYVEEQIKLKEAQLKRLTEEHGVRAKELQEQIDSLKGQKKSLNPG